MKLFSIILSTDNEFSGDITDSASSQKIYALVMWLLKQVFH